MHLLQLAANERAVVNDGEAIRLAIHATPNDDGDAAVVHVQAGDPDENEGKGQKLSVGETLVILFKDGGPPGEYPDPDGGDPLPFKPYADYDPDSDDDDDDDDEIDLKNQVQVTLVHIYGEEAVLRFAVPDEWGVAVAIAQE